MAHRLSVSVDDYAHPFALMYPGVSLLDRLAGLSGEVSREHLGKALEFARQNPDYMRELDRGDSMRARGLGRLLHDEDD